MRSSSGSRKKSGQRSCTWASSKLSSTASTATMTRSGRSSVSKTASTASVSFWKQVTGPLQNGEGVAKKISSAQSNTKCCIILVEIASLKIQTEVLDFFLNLCQCLIENLLCTVTEIIKFCLMYLINSFGLVVITQGTVILTACPQLSLKR